MRLGWRVRLPGGCQWSSGQRRRALGAATMYLSALAIAAMAWGTWLAWLLLGAAFLVHLVTLTDAIRSRNPMGFVCGVPVLTIGLGLACCVYVPAFGVAWRHAHPTTVVCGERARFLVNLAAFQGASPVTYDWVVYAGAGAERRIARVIATSRQEVFCRSGEFFVDGIRLANSPALGANTNLTLTVPEGCTLVMPAPTSDAATASPPGLVLVPNDQIVGRPWAQIAPLREWRLLL